MPIALSPLGLVGSRGGTGCRGLSGRNVADSVSAMPAGQSRGESGVTRRLVLIDPDQNPVPGPRPRPSPTQSPPSAGELGQDVADERLDLCVTRFGPAAHEIAEPRVAPFRCVPPRRLEV